MFGRLTNRPKRTEPELIPPDLARVRDRLDAIFAGCSDFLQREIRCGEKGAVRLLVAYLDGFVDKRALSQDVIRPILDHYSRTGTPERNRLVYDDLKEFVVSSNDVREAPSWPQAVQSIVAGDAVLFVEGESRALVIGVKAPKGRTIEEPNTELSVRGPREGFVEDLRVNINLLRKRIQNPNLKTEKLQVGEQTGTDICICYIKGIAPEEIVAEVKERLGKIKIDGILDAGYIEQYIADRPMSLFPLVGNSEKCDKVAGKLLEGRVAVLCNGTPYVLTVPYLLVEAIQTEEDYYEHPFYSTFMRFVRLLSLLIANLLPAVYVALVGYHQTVIPFQLMITLAASRNGIPFAPMTEAVLMLMAFELLREAGIRMPRPIGQAVSIVGAIVLGEASVSAGIASNLMVIIISITAICTFVVPPLIRTTMLLRFVFLAAAGLLGFLGISFVAIMVLTHLCRLHSFGVPYMTPFSPLTVSDLKDSAVMVPIWAMVTRPERLQQNHRSAVRREEVKR